MDIALSDMAILEIRRKSAACRASEGHFVFVQEDPRDHELTPGTEFATDQAVIAAWGKMLPAQQEVTRIFDHNGEEYAVQWYDPPGDCTGGAGCYILTMI